MNIRVEWDFGSTEFENLSYEEAIIASGLPDFVKIPTDVSYEDDDGISDWVSEKYGYTIIDWYKV